MKSVASYALGCKVNQYESEAIAELFAEKGYNIVGIDDKADVYVINTCTVTNFGDKKSRQLIRKVKRQNPEAVVAVIGCYAQTAPDDIINIEGVNIVIGTKGKNEIVNIVEEYDGGVKNVVGEIMKERQFERLKINRLSNRTRAYIKIQDGCSQFCSYCIIPYARGPIRSRSIDDIVDEVKALSKNGFKEVVLTGIHVASYGKDIGSINLTDVIDYVSEIYGIERIRLSSIEPNYITEQFVEKMSLNKKFCHHFHLSLQSGCDKTLKSMNRKYTTDEYRKAVETIMKYMPDAALTTDIIAGFPGESENDFKQCYDFAKSINFAKIHVFPFSPKRGTPAANMEEQVKNSVKNERVKKLLDLSQKSSEIFLKKQLGKTMDVLFERQEGPNSYEGHTSNYIKVIANSDYDIINTIKAVEITNIGYDGLEGMIKIN